MKLIVSRKVNRVRWLNTVDGAGSGPYMLFIGNGVRVLLAKDQYEFLGRPRKLFVDVTKETSD
jgi:hypothetical protein